MLRRLNRLSGVALEVTAALGVVVVALVMATAATRDTGPDRPAPALAYLATCPVEP